MTAGIILVVEDDPLCRLVLAKQLARLGYASRAVASGEEALQCNYLDVDLIFMDIGLPGMDGMQTTMQIRQQEASMLRKRVPIIAITAHSSREQCLAVGMDDFLQKPALLKDLEQSLDKWLGVD